MSTSPPLPKFRGPSEKQWVQVSVGRDPGLGVPSTKKWKPSVPLPSYSPSTEAGVGGRGDSFHLSETAQGEVPMSP